MDNSQKVATALSVFLAIVMLCGGAMFLGYVRGFQNGHTGSDSQAYTHGKDEGYQAGYQSGLQAGYKPPTEAQTTTGFTSKNPTYQQMKTFLLQDTTNNHTYVENSYVCVDFAAAVNNNARLKAFAAPWSISSTPMVTATR